MIYLVWIRNTERYSREPYKRLLIIFLYGAVFSVSIALVVEVALMILLSENVERVYEVLGDDPSITALILACVIAPFVEEAAKGLGVMRSRRFITELENGIVYGAAVGLGFAATENLLYENAALIEGGTQAFIATAIVRSISSALLHASASSVFGLGIAKKAMGLGGWLPFYLAAVLMHGVFNFAASFGVLYEDEIGQLAYSIGLVAAIAIALLGISTVRSKIRSLDSGRERARIRRVR